MENNNNFEENDGSYEDEDYTDYNEEKPKKRVKKILNYINPNNKGPNIRLTFDILVYFLITFSIIRISVYSMIYGHIPELYIYIRGIHIHHLNFGIFILAFVGYLSLFVKKDHIKEKIARLYGIGLAFTFDEFGLWLFLRDDYWVRQSYDAIILITLIFLNIIYFNKIWCKIFYKSISICRSAFLKEENGAV